VTGNRTYTMQTDGKQQRAKALLRSKVKEEQWHILNDEGVRVLSLGGAETSAVGSVSLMLVEKMADGERFLYVAPAELSQEDRLGLMQVALAAEQAEPENSKLVDMVALLEKSKSFIRAQTATFDAWFHVTWFIQAVLDLEFKRVVLPAKTDRLYAARGQMGKRSPSPQAYLRTGPTDVGQTTQGQGRWLGSSSVGLCPGY